MKRILTTDLAGIPALAQKMAHTLAGGEVIALIGQLGAGKTTFAKTLARKLRIKAHVTSPTFVLMNRYPARLPSAKQKIHLYHLDLYRTKNFAEAKALGLQEFWGQPATVTIIEWADKIKRHLPRKTIFIYFKET